MTTRTELEDLVKQCKINLGLAEANLYKFDTLAENNVFESLDVAEAKLEDMLRERAHEDCEGAYNCGNDEYRQEFMVNNVKYVAIATFEYNRHDKTYYYIDGSDFRVEKL
jgi:hypothetical protein